MLNETPQQKRYCPICYSQHIGVDSDCFQCKINKLESIRKRNVSIFVCMSIFAACLIYLVNKITSTEYIERSVNITEEKTEKNISINQEYALLDSIATKCNISVSYVSKNVDFAINFLYNHHKKITVSRLAVLAHWNDGLSPQSRTALDAMMGEKSTCSDVLGAYVTIIVQ